MPRRVIRIGLVFVMGIATCACAPAHRWVADEVDQPAAEVPIEPIRCRDVSHSYHPPRPALLGSPPTKLREWARKQLPDHFSVRGGSKRFGFMPNGSPGAAIQAKVAHGRIVGFTIQSNGSSVSTSTPLSQTGVHRFLLATTGCGNYRVCDARLSLDDARYAGHTVCPNIILPVQLVTPRYGRNVVSVAVWLPHLGGEL